MNIKRGLLTLLVCVPFTASWAHSPFFNGYPVNYGGSYIPPQVDAGAVLSWEIHNNQQQRIENGLINGTPINGANYYDAPNRAPSVICSAQNSRNQVFVASGPNPQFVKNSLLAYCVKTDPARACAVQCR